jgi:hypothetical protein
MLSARIEPLNVESCVRRFRLYRPAHILNRLRAGEQSRRNFRIVRNFDRVGDADVAQVAHLFANMNRAAALLDRRIGEQVIEALLGPLESYPGGMGVCVDVHFPVGAAGDGNIAGSVGELQANRAAYAKRAVEAAAHRRSHRAARARQADKQ